MGLFDAEDTSHDYVNLVMSKGLDIWQMITGLCTGVAFQARGGGGIPTYGLYRYVPRNRVWFLLFSVLK